MFRVERAATARLVALVSMPLLTELVSRENRVCYRHGAPNGAVFASQPCPKGVMGGVMRLSCSQHTFASGCDVGALGPLPAERVFIRRAAKLQGRPGPTAVLATKPPRPSGQSKWPSPFLAELGFRKAPVEWSGGAPGLDQWLPMYLLFRASWQMAIRSCRRFPHPLFSSRTASFPQYGWRPSLVARCPSAAVSGHV